jgi:hypothetical protein
MFELLALNRRTRSRKALVWASIVAGCRKGERPPRTSGLPVVLGDAHHVTRPGSIALAGPPGQAHQAGSEARGVPVFSTERRATPGVSPSRPSAGTTTAAANIPRGGDRYCPWHQLDQGDWFGRTPVMDERRPLQDCTGRGPGSRQMTRGNLSRCPGRASLDPERPGASGHRGSAGQVFGWIRAQRVAVRLCAPSLTFG